MELSSPRAKVSVTGRREALLWKRQAIDKEIAAFAAQKEEEYRQFEEEVISGAEAEPAPLENGPGVTVRDRNLQVLREDKPAHIDFRDGDISTQNQSTRPIERDDALEQVFGPSFLPFLEKKSQGPELLSAEVQSNSRHDVTQKKDASGYSTSATLPTRPPLLCSLPRSVSASAPKEEPTYRRRSSSRSDISVGSLRSSLRDPQQTRSPKRVLFSIDNVVVSPSTSPIQERPPKSRSLPVRVSSAPQSFGVDIKASEVGKETKGSSGWQKVASATPARNTNPSSLSGSQANGQRIISYASNMAPQPGQGASALANGDDFESVDIEEDVFGFDDQVAAKKPTSTLKFDLEEDFGSDEDRVNENGITSTSPHAGSLPIEIRWPMRSDPRKA